MFQDLSVADSPKRMGRPKGSKNKPKLASVVPQKVDVLTLRKGEQLMVIGVNEVRTVSVSGLLVITQQ